jgi:hypothetical protein
MYKIDSIFGTATGPIIIIYQGLQNGGLISLIMMKATPRENLT